MTRSVLLDSLLLTHIASFLNQPYVLDLLCKPILAIRENFGMYLVNLSALPLPACFELLNRRVHRLCHQVIGLCHSSTLLTADNENLYLSQLRGVKLIFAFEKYTSACKLQNLLSLSLNQTSFNDIMTKMEQRQFSALEELSIQIFDVGQELPVIDFSFLESCRNITSFKCRYPLVFEFEIFSILTKLTSLDLSGTIILNLDFIVTLVHLKVLILENTRIKDIGPIEKLSFLCTLNIIFTHVKDLMPVQKLGKLRDLCLGYSGINDLSILADCLELKVLKMHRLAYLPVSSLLSAKTVLSLNIYYTDWLDFSVLKAFSSLIVLKISEDELDSLDWIEALKRLETLHLKCNYLNKTASKRKQNEAWSSLGSLTELTELKLRVRKITNIRFLKTLTKLKILYFQRFRDRKYINIDGIQYLLNLEHLTMIGVKRNSSCLLNGLTRLKTLRMQ